MLYSILRKKIIYLLIFLIIIVLMSHHFIYINILGKSRIEIITLKGDENLIKDLKIQGLFGDNKTSFEFNIDGNKKEVKALRGDEKRIVNYYHYYNGKNNSVVLNYDFPIKNPLWYIMTYGFEEAYSKNNYERAYVQILRSKSQDSRPIDSKIIAMDMQPKKGNAAVSSFYHGGLKGGVDDRIHPLNVMKQIGEKLYFILPSHQGFTGNSGIYEIQYFDKGKPKNIINEHGAEEILHSKEGYRKLADIDLRDGQVEVKGLYGQGDNLYIVMHDANKVLVKLFSLKDENFIDELTVFEYPKERYDAKKGIYNDRFFEFVNYGSLHNNYLNLSIPSEKTIRIITIEFNGQLRVINDIDIDNNFHSNLLEIEKNMSLVIGEQYIHDIIYKDGFIYTIEEQEIKDWNRILSSYTTRNYQLVLSAYNKYGIIEFSGKVETGLNDDNIVEETEKPHLLEKYVNNIIKRRYYTVKFR